MILKSIPNEGHGHLKKSTFVFKSSHGGGGGGGGGFGGGFGGGHSKGE